MKRLKQENPKTPRDARAEKRSLRRKIDQLEGDKAKADKMRCLISKGIEDLRAWTEAPCEPTSLEFDLKLQRYLNFTRAIVDCNTDNDFKKIEEEMRLERLLFCHDLKLPHPFFESSDPYFFEIQPYYLEEWIEGEEKKVHWPNGRVWAVKFPGAHNVCPLKDKSLFATLWGSPWCGKKKNGVSLWVKGNSHEQSDAQFAELTITWDLIQDGILNEMAFRVVGDADLKVRANMKDLQNHVWHNKKWHPCYEKGSETVSFHTAHHTLMVCVKPKKVE